MNIDIIKLIEIIKVSYSYADLCEKYFGYINGKKIKMLNNFIHNNVIDISHFDSKHYNKKYEIVEKKCPVCDKNFKVKKGSPREKRTCSYRCSNRYFRSGYNNGNWKNIEDMKNDEGKYKKICFINHKKECIICKEKNIVTVHHYDFNHGNNNPNNLVPLCPTHHQYVHSKYYKLVKDKIENYIEEYNKTTGCSSVSRVHASEVK